MKSGLGRKRREDNYSNPMDYLNEVVFPTTDALDEYKKIEREANRKHEAAKAKVKLQTQKLQYAYDGMQKFRR